MSAKYVISRNSQGLFHFILKAENDEAILSSESYSSQAAAENGIQSVRVNGNVDARYEIRTTESGHFYFALKAANHQIIGMSNIYGTKDAVRKAIERVKSAAPIATVS